MTRRSTPQWKVDERRFPVRLRVIVPPGGFGAKLEQMHAWLDRRVGRDGYAVWSEAGRGWHDSMLVHVNELETAAEFVAAFELQLAGG